MKLSRIAFAITILAALLLAGDATAQLPYKIYSGKQILGGKPVEVNMTALSRIDQVLPVPPRRSRVHEPLPDPRPRQNGPRIDALNPESLDGGGPLDPSNLITDFLGIDSNEENYIFVPPDTHGAVGPSHLMVSTNNSVRVQQRDGTVLSTVSQATFFSALGNFSFGPFDPKVIYDKFADRWVLVALDGTGFPSDILLAVSKSGDPTGGWYEWRIASDPTGGTWFDYPKIGANSKWVVISGNMFPNSASYTNALFIFDKSKLYNGTSATLTRIEVPDGFNLSVSDHNDNGPDLYSLDEWNGAAGQLRLLKISGSVGNETVTTIGYPQLPVGWTGADLAPQKNSGSTIETLDPRIINTVVRNGYIWGAHDIGPLTGPGRCAVQWFQIGLDGTVGQWGRIDDPTGTDFYFMGTIAVNGLNGAVLGFSKSNTGMFPSAAYAYRYSTDPPGTFHPHFLYKDGSQPWDSYRWGDYSATVVDPVDDTNFWTIQEYTPTTYGDYGLWWANIAGVPPPLSISVSPSVVFAGDTATGTVSINPAAPAGGADVLLTSTNPAVADVPASVHVNEGETTALFTVQTYDTGAGVQKVDIVATRGADTATTTITVVPYVVEVDFFDGLFWTPAFSVTGGELVQSRVIIATNAPTPNGVVVNLTSQDPNVCQVTPSVTVPAGADRQYFYVFTTPVANDEPVEIRGSARGSSATGVLTVLAPVPTSILLQPSTVEGGNTSAATVYLTGNAPNSGLDVTLSSDKPDAQVPQAVHVQPGKNSGAFVVNTTPVANKVVANITATYNGVSASAPLTITSAGLSSFTISPSQIGANATATATAVLSSPAPNGATVTLSYVNGNALVSPPTSITIDPGKSSGFKTLTGGVVTNSTQVTVTATYKATSKQAMVTVLGNRVTSVTSNPQTLHVSTKSSCKVYLAQPAPAGGVVVNLTATAGELPQSVRILANQTTASFSFKAPSSPPANGKAIITATYPAGISVTTAVNIIP